MKKGFKGCLVLGLMVMALSFSGCTLHVTKHISDKLDQEAMYKTYDVRPMDLSTASKCPAPPSVKIVNAETREEDYHAFRNPPYKGYINPRIMMDNAAAYLKGAYEKSNIKVDDSSGKVIELKMIELQSVAGAWSFGSNIKLEVTIPEKKITRVYEAQENAGNGFSAAAYVIHKASQQILYDPAVLDYILCK